MKRFLADGLKIDVIRFRSSGVLHRDKGKPEICFFSKIKMIRCDGVPYMYWG